MKRLLQSQEVVTGLAMFSMFFGAGNVVFPLLIGRDAGASNIYAITGLLLTAVLVPFLGLASMVLFDGDYKKFFSRIGTVPAFLALIFIICAIGPFNALPRCIVLSYAAIKGYIPGVTLPYYILFSAAVIFALCIKESKILDILGYFLSPALVISLVVIIVKGLLYSPAPLESSVSAKELFMTGLITGYNTMDLLATFFFSSIVITTLKQTMGAKTAKDTKKLAMLTFRASCIGAGLLGVIYLGMSYVASFQGGLLAGVPDAELLVAIAQNVAGQLSFIASLAVALACLTTAITLAAVSTDFIRFEVFDGKVSYVHTLIGVLAISIYVANYDFYAIVKMAAPVLGVIYPAIIVLAITNIAYKLYGFKYAMVPFYGTLLISLLSSLR